MFWKTTARAVVERSRPLSCWAERMRSRYHLWQPPPMTTPASMPYSSWQRRRDRPSATERRGHCRWRWPGVRDRLTRAGWLIVKRGLRGPTVWRGRACGFRRKRPPGRGSCCLFRWNRCGRLPTTDCCCLHTKDRRRYDSGTSYLNSLQQTEMIRIQ